MLCRKEPLLRVIYNILKYILCTINFRLLNSHLISRIVVKSWGMNLFEDISDPLVERGRILGLILMPLRPHHNWSVSGLKCILAAGICIWDVVSCFEEGLEHYNKFIKLLSANRLLETYFLGCWAISTAILFDRRVLGGQVFDPESLRFHFWWYLSINDGFIFDRLIKWLKTK